MVKLWSILSVDRKKVAIRIHCALWLRLCKYRPERECLRRKTHVCLFFLNKFIYLFIYLFIFGCVGSSFLCEGFLQLRRAGATLHRGVRASHCHGLSLRSTGSRRAGSVAVAHGPSCSAACGIFPDQGSNPCPLHRQADSQPLCHQGSPENSC